MLESVYITRRIQGSSHLPNLPTERLYELALEGNRQHGDTRLTILEY
jgi:hypothetical protein